MSAGRSGSDVLFVGLTENFVSLLSLFFKQLHPARQRLVLRAVLRALIGSLLEIDSGLFQSLELGLQNTILVLHGCELLVLGQVLCLKLLDLVL